MSRIVPFSLAQLSPFSISLRIRDVTALGGDRQLSWARAAPDLSAPRNSSAARGAAL